MNKKEHQSDKQTSFYEESKEKLLKLFFVKGKNEKDVSLKPVEIMKLYSFELITVCFIFVYPTILFYKINNILMKTSNRIYSI